MFTSIGHENNSIALNRLLRPNFTNSFIISDRRQKPEAEAVKRKVDVNYAIAACNPSAFSLGAQLEDV
jgi:hypothetical protein